MTTTDDKLREMHRRMTRVRQFENTTKDLPLKVLPLTLSLTLGHRDVDGAPVAEAELTSRLREHSFTGTSRHGKYLFATLDGGDVLVVHFGMTGHLKYCKDPHDEVEGARLICTFANGYHMAYASARRLGELRLIQDVDAFVLTKELGPDAPDDGFDFDEFRERFFENVKSVLRIAVEHGAQPAGLPEDFIIPRRHENAVCPVCGVTIERINVGGRTAYVCPGCQRNPAAGQGTGQGT
jgi:formamidopyrimidine-DNA glycosylase